MFSPLSYEIQEAKTKKKKKKKEEEEEEGEKKREQAPQTLPKSSAEPKST